MTPQPTDGHTWDFSRCALTGQIALWPREDMPPHWVGTSERETSTALRPAAICMPNPLNQSVRMLRLSQAQQRWARSYAVQVAGEVAAGRYDVTVAYLDSPEAPEILLLPPEEVPSGCFALRVRGTSMQEAGICHGDFVLVRPQRWAERGDFVVAALANSTDPEGYVTLKQFFPEQDHVRLQPANASMAPIHLHPQNGRDPVEIQGKVVAIVRLEEDDLFE